MLAEHGLTCVPYFGLARGFLTGKYRPGTTVDSPRAAGRVGLPRRARARGARRARRRGGGARRGEAAVALAWLAAQPTVAAPLASARSTDQLADLLPTLSLTLTDAEVAALSAASRP